MGEFLGCFGLITVFVGGGICLTLAYGAMKAENCNSDVQIVYELFDRDSREVVDSMTLGGSYLSQSDSSATIHNNCDIGNLYVTKKYFIKEKRRYESRKN